MLRYVLTMTQPRLLPDYAAVPTRRERNAARVEARRAQLALFTDADPMAPAPCAACTSTDHTTTRCPLGIALTLNTGDTTPMSTRRRPDADYRRVTPTRDEIDAWRAKHPTRSTPSVYRVACTRCELRYWGSGIAIGSHRRACPGHPPTTTDTGDTTP